MLNFFIKLDFNSINIIKFQKSATSESCQSQIGPAAGLRRSSHILNKQSFTDFTQRKNYSLHRVIP